MLAGVVVGTLAGTGLLTGSHAGQAATALGFLLTIALGILLRGLMILIWTAQSRNPAQVLGIVNRPIEILPGAFISTLSLALVVTNALVFAGLFALLQFTRWGLRMRAAGQNPSLAAQRGINLYVAYALAWGLATFTVGTAGILIALDTGLDTTMITIGLRAFPAALVGGLDSLLGALVGSIIVATAEVVLIQKVNPLLSDVVPFAVLLVMLVIRPWGLFGTREQLDRV